MCCLKLETNQVPFVLQGGSAVLVKVEYIVERDGDLLHASLLVLAQTNCWSCGGSIKIIDLKLL